MQFDDKSGVKLTVAYASAKLKNNECKYYTIENECSKFQLHLTGREFLIENDHQS